MENKLVDSVEALMEKIEQVRKAQEKFATYTQEQVDKIFRAAALAANNQRIPLAKMAVAETGMVRNAVERDALHDRTISADNEMGCDQVPVAIPEVHDVLGSGFALGVMEHDILLMLRPFFAMVEAGTVVFDDIEGRTKLFGRRRGRNGGIAPPVGFVKQEIVRRLKLRFVERVLFCRIGRWPGSRTGARGACERQHAQDEDRPRASLAAVTTDREILSLPPRRGWPPHSDVRIR